MTILKSLKQSDFSDQATLPSSDVTSKWCINTWELRLLSKLCPELWHSSHLYWSKLRYPKVIFTLMASSAVSYWTKKSCSHGPSTKDSLPVCGSTFRLTSWPRVRCKIPRTSPFCLIVTRKDMVASNVTSIRTSFSIEYYRQSLTSRPPQIQTGSWSLSSRPASGTTLPLSTISRS